MTRTKLENMLNEKGVSIGSLALELKVTTESIYSVLRGRTTSRRIEAVLEEVFEMPIVEIRKAWMKRNNARLNLAPIVERANSMFGRRSA